MDNNFGTKSNDPREKVERYRPLDRRSAARFITDWESLVNGVLSRMRLAEPEEALSRVFQKALRGLPDFRSESRLSTWLYRIAWREGLRQLQRENRHRDREVSLDLAVSRPDGKDDQLQTLQRQETAVSVRDALSKLSVRDREVLALRYLEELPFAMVAERLSIAETAAKVRSHRALTRLRIILEER